MRRLVFAIFATLAILAVGALLPTRADAMTLTAPAGLSAAIPETSAIEDVRWRCHRWHRHHHWRRHCGWRRWGWWGPRWWGWGWHHRHWRHHRWWW